MTVKERVDAAFKQEVDWDAGGGVGGGGAAAAEQHCIVVPRFDMSSSALEWPSSKLKQPKTHFRI